MERARNSDSETHVKKYNWTSGTDLSKKSLWDIFFGAPCSYISHHGHTWYNIHQQINHHNHMILQTNFSWSKVELYVIMEIGIRIFYTAFFSLLKSLCGVWKTHSRGKVKHTFMKSLLEIFKTYYEVVIQSLITKGSFYDEIE